MTNEQNGSVKRSSTGASVEYLRDAPPEIRDDALELLRAQEINGTPRLGARQRFLRWYQLRCFPLAAQPGASPDQQRFAPPLSSAFAACNAGNRLPAVDQYNAAHPNTDRITILGDMNAPDPYGGRMMGLASSSKDGFRDDATARPAPGVNHPGATISDTSGPFGSRVAGVLMVSWRDHEHTIGVFGRGYTLNDEEALIALANRVTVDGRGRPQLAPLDWPPGDGVVFEGPLDEVSTVAVDPRWTFVVDANKETVRLSASVRADAASEAIRFLGTGLQPVTVAGVRFLAGPLIATGQPGDGGLDLVRWTAADGVSLSLTSVSARGRPALTLDQLEKIAVTIRKLDRSEWEQVVGRSDGCVPEAVARAAASTGSKSPSRSSTSTTASSEGR